MKKLLLLLLIGICGLAWRSEDILKMIGMASQPSAAKAQLQMPAPGQKAPAGMSISEYAELARTDPDAYRKLFASHQQAEERSQVDKLMNFLAHGKYE